MRSASSAGAGDAHAQRARFLAASRRADSTSSASRAQLVDQRDAAA